MDKYHFPPVERLKDSTESSKFQRLEYVQHLKDSLNNMFNSFRIKVKVLCSLIALILALTSLSGRAEVLSLNALPAWLQEMRSQGTVRCSFTMEKSDFEQYLIHPELLWFATARGGIRNLRVIYYTNGDVELENMEWWDFPMMEVRALDDITAAAQIAASDHLMSFGLLPENRTLYEDIMARPGNVRRMLLQAGLMSYEKNCYQDQGCAVWYEGCIYKPVTYLEPEISFQSAETILEAGLNGAETIVTGLNEKSWQMLETDMFKAWSSASGFSGRHVVMEDARCVIFGETEDAFYPGVRIAAAVRAGKEQELPVRYQEALLKAQEIVEGVSGTDLEQYRMLNDRLALAITYTIDEQSDDDDTCIGALIDGKANCDGYADAFFLCCRLMGLPVHYVNGNSKERTDPETGHMWNMIQVDGSWRSVDVTWSDQEWGIDDRCFNIGLEKMREFYLFEEEMLPQPMQI